MVRSNGDLKVRTLLDILLNVLFFPFVTQTIFRSRTPVDTEQYPVLSNLVDDKSERSKKGVLLSLYRRSLDDLF